jgi:hypothetical protein
MTTAALVKIRSFPFQRQNNQLSERRGTTALTGQRAVGWKATHRYMLSFLCFSGFCTQLNKNVSSRTADRQNIVFAQTACHSTGIKSSTFIFWYCTLETILKRAFDTLKDRPLSAVTAISCTNGLRWRATALLGGTATTMRSSAVHRQTATGRHTCNTKKSREYALTCCIL